MKQTDGSVAAAVSSTPNKKFQTQVYAETGELRRAIRDADRLNETRIAAQTATATAQSALAAAKKTVTDLNIQIEESKTAHRKMDGKLTISRDNLAIAELEPIKRESNKLKQDIACILDERRNAEKEKDYYLSRAASQQRSVEALTKEIAERYEEHVLVELARIEAVKERDQVEAQRKDNAQNYLAAINEVRTKQQQLIQRIQDAEELEQQLAVTESDANVLASELKLVTEMHRGLQRIDDESVMEDMEAAKKELESIKAGSFQLITSMDGVRSERDRIRIEIAGLKKEEEKSETTIQNLTSKLLRAKAKLEDAIATEEKAKSIASTQSFMLEQLLSEADAAMKEHSLISEETAIAMEDLQRAEDAKAVADDKLHTVLQELKAAKLSEATALEDLRVHTENTMRSRDLASSHSSRITISMFEYEYLTGHAAGAEEIADKKVAAAEAWIEALRASEKELQIRYQRLETQSREMNAPKEKEVKNGSYEKSEISEFEKWRRTSMATDKLKPEMSNKSVNSMKTSRGKARISGSPSMPRTTSFTIKRRKIVMPNLAKFFSRGRAEEEFSSI